MEYSYNYDTMLGPITIITDGTFLTAIKFGKEKVGILEESFLIKDIKKQIDEYLSGNRNEFEVKLRLRGTPFQVKVWEELKKIKYGECISYQELAEIIQNKSYARAVGMANNKNPIPIIIPCHRVIGKKGNLVGYAGGIDIKNKLLEIEKNYKKRQK